MPLLKMFQFSLLTILLLCPLTFGSQDENFGSQDEISGSQEETFGSQEEISGSQNDSSVLSSRTCVSSCKLALANVEHAIHTLTMAKNIYQCTDCKADGANSSQPQDCFELLNAGEKNSGIYTIFPRNRVLNGRPIKVYCDMQTDGGGWTVIQRRGNFERPEDYFYKDWESYKRGFGDLDKDFWLGNDVIYAISNQKKYSARFDLTDVQSISRYAQYDLFWIDDENYNYTLHIQDYRGNAGDSMTAVHNGMKFTTKDRKNDLAVSNCAKRYKGGWWYRNCYKANLNGLYLRGKYKGINFANTETDGLTWFTFKGYNESLEKTEIKLRPKPTQSR